jgi:glyoxylate carboligase
MFVSENVVMAGSLGLSTSHRTPNGTLILEKDKLFLMLPDDLPFLD